MIKIPYFTTVLAALSWWSLACEAPKEDPVQRYAKAFCECSGGIALLDRQAAELAASSDTVAQEKLTGLLAQLQAEYATAQKCLNPLIVQQGRLSQEELVKIYPIIQQKCPDAAANRDLIRELIGQ